MNDTVDNQGANILGFINGREIIKRSWRVLSKLIKFIKHFYEECTWESVRSFHKHKLFLNM